MQKEKLNANAAIQPSKDERALAVIGYLWILCLLPLLSKKDSEFVQHHAKQGLVLTIASFAIWLVAWFPLVGWLVGFFGTIGVLILAVNGIQNALQGKYWEMPLLGKYARQIKL